MKLVTLLLLLLVVPFAYSEGLQFIANPNERQTLTANCYNNSLLVNAKANVTIYYPNNAVFVANQTMTQYKTGQFNYTFTTPSILGTYESVISCVASTARAQNTGRFQVKNLEDDVGLTNVALGLLFIAFLGFFLYISHTEIKKGGIHKLIGTLFYNGSFLMIVLGLWFMVQITAGKPYWFFLRNLYNYSWFFFAAFVIISIVMVMFEFIKGWTGNAKR